MSSIEEAQDKPRENEDLIFENDIFAKQLPSQMSIAFTLREIDGLTSTEICEILNITQNNLWVLLHRGRNKLRHLLEVEWFQKDIPSPPLYPKRSKSYTAETRDETHLSYRAAAA